MTDAEMIILLGIIKPQAEKRLKIKQKMVAVKKIYLFISILKIF